MEKEVLTLLAAFVGGSAFKTLIDYFMNRLKDDPHKLLFTTLMEANQKQAERIAVLEHQNSILQAEILEIRNATPRKKGRFTPTANSTQI